MKRSEINNAIKEMEALIKAHGLYLPPFAGWTAEDWNDKGHEYDEIREAMLGWDITDYGLGDWNRIGMALITIRNGVYGSDIYTKQYAEKLLMVKEGQYSPMHFHWKKTEDIINRGGGTLIVRLYNSDENYGFAETDVCVNSDGRTYFVKAGTDVYLEPGQSITLKPGTYHDFNVLKGSGDVLLGEVSMCNDDNNDNYFYENVGRFPKIEEDAPVYRCLCNEYPVANNTEI